MELLSFSGRNPIGVVGLKAGVSGGGFNSRGFADLGDRVDVAERRRHSRGAGHQRDVR